MGDTTTTATARARRFSTLADQYPGDYDASDHDASNADRWALIERSQVNGSYWLTTHESPADAADYNTTQDDADDWTPLLLVDLDTGDERQADREVSAYAVTFGDPLDSEETGGTWCNHDAPGTVPGDRCECGETVPGVGPDDWPTTHVDGITVGLGRAPDGIMVVQIDGADDLHGETEAGPVMRVHLNDHTLYAVPGKSDEPELAVGTFPDRSQILITRWPDGTVEIARRDGLSRVWGPPVAVETGR